MSQHQNQSDDTINANAVAFVIMTFFVLISILLISQLPKNIASQKVALAEATVEAQPSATPLPPTLPPTSTPTLMPSATPTELPPTVASTPTLAADTSQTTSASAVTDYDPALIARGQQQFMLCTACHGPDGRGLPNLGKDLVTSEFVHSLSDDELLTFVKTGRPIWDPLNTTGIDMPPKGGNPAMTDDDILAVIAYVRSLSGTVPASTEAATDTVQAIATSEPVADTGQTSNSAMTAYDPAMIARGQEQFVLCSACHGPDGRGIPNLGKDLIASEFVHSQTDEELLTFVKTGRPIWDPLNTTGIDMPPKGGNPAMTDEDIMAIIAYVRSLSASGG